MSRENSDNVTVQLSAQDILNLRDRLLLIADVAGFDASAANGYTAAFGRDFISELGRQYAAESGGSVQGRSAVRAEIANRVMAGATDAQLQAVGFDNAQEIITYLDSVGSVVDTLDQVVATHGFEAVEQSLSGGGTPPAQTRTEPEQPTAPAIPPEVRERVMRIEQQLQRAAAGLGESANIPQAGAVDGVFDSQSFATYEAMLAFMAKKADVPVPAGGYTPEFGRQIQEAMIGKIDTALAVYGAPGGVYLLRGQLGVDTDAEVVAQIAMFRQLRQDLPQLVSDLNFLHGRGALQVTEAPAAPSSGGAPSDGADPSAGSEGGSGVQPGDQELMEKHDNMLVLGQLIGVEVPADQIYTKEFGAQVEARLEALLAEKAATLPLVYTREYMDEQALTMLVAEMGMTDEASVASVRDYIENISENRAALDTAADAERSFPEIIAALQGGQSQGAATPPPLTAEQQIVENHNQIILFGDLLNIERPPNDTYTAEYGAQVIEKMNQLGESAYTELGGARPATPEAIRAAAATQLVTFLSQIDPQALANMGFESPDDVLEAVQNLDQTVAGLDSVIASGRSFADISQTAVSQAQAAQDAAGAGTPTPPPPSGAGEGEPNIQGSTLIVEQALLQIGNSLSGENMPGIAGMVTQFIPQEALFTPLTEAQASDGVWDSASQDLASRIIMGLKYLDAQGDENAPQNIDGTYNEQIGEQLKISILTEPQFASIRDAMGLEQVADANTANAIVNYDRLVEQNNQAIQQAMSQYNMTEEEVMSNPQFRDLHQERNRLQQLEREHGRTIEAARTNLNAFFDNLTVLQQQGVYDNAEARKTTTMNMMLDAAGHMLDQFAPGLKTWLQDFFTNSEFGQMVSGVLTMFGINVGRLWGDRDDEGALERARPAIEGRFTDFYEEARQSLGTDDHAQIMARTRDNIMEEMDNSAAFKTAMGIIFEDQDETVIRDAIEQALNAAAQQPDFEASKAAFTESLIEQGRAFRNGREFDDAEVTRLLTQAQDEIASAVAENPDFAPQGGSPEVPPANDDGSLDTGTTRGLQDGAQQGPGQGGGAAIVPQSAEYERDPTRPAIDEDVTEYGDDRVSFVYRANTEDMIQGPLRYADGRVDDIQDVLARNASALELSLSGDMMRKNDGVFSDTLGRQTNAIIEETLIRAQLHRIAEEGGEITQATLDGLDRKLSLENLDVVTAYMTDKGVSVEDINRFAANVTNLGQDYKSTVPGDRNAGERQEHSVLTQSIFGGQFDLDISQWAPRADDNPTLTQPIPADNGANDLERRYLEGNRNCSVEGPLFYTKEGSDSVFAIIRDKGGDEDPANDTYRELEFDNYLNDFRIQMSDAGDLSAILENYNISNPTELGVRNLIECELGLNGHESTHYLQPDPNAQVREEQPETRVRERPQRAHEVPETYTDLRILGREDRAAIIELLGLDENENLMARAERDIRDPLDMVFEDAMGADRLPRPTDFKLLNLRDFGVEHPHIDVLVAVPSADGIQIRYVDYETDYIRPLEDQRASGMADINQAHNISGPRRLDDFLDEIHRSPGGGVVEGMQGGYRGMISIMPYADYVRPQNSVDAVYGGGTSANHIYRYIENWHSRNNERSQYEFEQTRDSMLYRNGGVTNGGAGYGDRTGYPYSSDRQRGFNDQAGSDQGYRPGPFGRRAGENHYAAVRLFQGIFGGRRDEPPELRDYEREMRIRQNMADMGITTDPIATGEVDLRNRQGFNLGAGSDR